MTVGPRRPVSSRLTPQGWICLGASLGFSTALIWQQPIPWSAFFGFALMASLTVAVALIPRRLRRVQSEWLLPEEVHAGEEMTIGLRLSADPGAPPVTVAAWDPQLQAPTFISDLPGLGPPPTPTRLAWVSRFPQRGPVSLPPPRVSCEQPFGLLVGELSIGGEHNLLVYPAIGRVQHGVEEDLLSWIAEGGETHAAGDDELAHLRFYRPGDSLRLIHWRASARARSLLVTERHEPLARRLCLLIDNQTDHRHTSRLERSIAIAASLIDHLLRRGWTLSLAGPGFPTEGLHGDRQHLMTGLATLTAMTSGPELTSCIPPHVPCLALLLRPQRLPENRLLRAVLPEAADRLVALPRGLR